MYLSTSDSIRFVLWCAMKKGVFVAAVAAAVIIVRYFIPPYSIAVVADNRATSQM